VIIPFFIHHFKKTEQMHGHRDTSKGHFSLKNGILVALRRFFIIIFDELWKVHSGVMDRE